MNLRYRISGKNITITEALRETVMEKIGKLEKYFTTDVDAIITMSVEKQRHIIEVTIPLKGSIIRAEEEAESIRLYNPLNRKLEGSSIIIKDDTERYDYNEIIDFDSKHKRNILKNKVLIQYKKENSKVIIVDYVRADKEGKFFAPIKNLLNENNSIFIRTEDGVLHKVELQRGKINMIKF